MRFSFMNQPLTNRYSLVKNYPEQKIITNEVPKLPHPVIPRVITTEFYKRPQRPSFVSPLDPPNESRLDPTQTLMSFNTIKKVTEKGDHALAIGKVASRDE